MIVCKHYLVPSLAHMRRYREVYDVIIKTLRMHTDDTVHVPAWLAKAMFAPKDWARRSLPNLPMSSWMSSAGYVEEVTRDKVGCDGRALGGSVVVRLMKNEDSLPGLGSTHLPVTLDASVSDKVS